MNYYNILNIIMLQGNYDISNRIFANMNLFEKNIVGIYREKGRKWLVDLPQLVQQYQVLWELTDLKPFNNLSYHYVLSGYQKGKPIVLKLGLDQRLLDHEAKALQAFAEFGGVALLEHRADAILLQRAMPGHSLKSQPLIAIHVTCQVMEKLHQASVPLKGHFPHIKEWLAALDQEWDIPTNLLKTARKLKNQLLPTLSSPILLHGDLHRDNILSNGDEWLVIDPKGVIGYPVNEMWACVEEPQHDLPLF